MPSAGRPSVTAPTSTDHDLVGKRRRLEYNDGASTTTTSYVYNTADQLTRETTGESVTSYPYDANGNLTRKDDGTNVHAYKYDFRNLMTDCAVERARCLRDEQVGEGEEAGRPIPRRV
jgi:YD repeat-containing protein